MEDKKTLKYLNDMKNSKMPPFDSQYEFSLLHWKIIILQNQTVQR